MLDRYKTRAHKAEAKLQEEITKEKNTSPVAEVAGDTLATTSTEESQQIMLNKVMDVCCCCRGDVITIR